MNIDARESDVVVGGVVPGEASDAATDAGIGEAKAQVEERCAIGSSVFAKSTKRTKHFGYLFGRHSLLLFVGLVRMSGPPAVINNIINSNNNKKNHERVYLFEIVPHSLNGCDDGSLLIVGMDGGARIGNKQKQSYTQLNRHSSLFIL